MALEVVTYDPLRRKGFMRVIDPKEPGRVHFALGALPESFKRPVIEMSRPLNRDLSDQDFKQLMREVRRAVVGARFRASIFESADGCRKMVRETIALVPAPGGPDRGASPTCSAGISATDSESGVPAPAATPSRAC